MNAIVIQSYKKRFFDIAFSLFFLAMLFVPLIIIAFWVKLSSKGPVIYWSERVGKDGTHFFMPKFRTMHTSTPNIATHLLTNPDNFITPTCKFLRKTSIDELPQLISILWGDMSFVGPRPALFNQVDLISLRKQYGICGLRPGLTGWAQVNGRDELSTEKKVQYDLEYLKNQSFCFDIRILWLTFFYVVLRRGISH